MKRKVFAVAIRDGFMETGEHFCKKGNRYNGVFDSEKTENPYIINDDNTADYPTSGHFMPVDFFDKYFKETAQTLKDLI